MPPFFLSRIFCPPPPASLAGARVLVPLSLLHHRGSWSSSSSYPGHFRPKPAQGLHFLLAWGLVLLFSMSSTSTCCLGHLSPAWNLIHILHVNYIFILSESYIQQPCTNYSSSVYHAHPFKIMKMLGEGIWWDDGEVRRVAWSSGLLLLLWR